MKKILNLLGTLLACSCGGTRFQTLNVSEFINAIKQDGVQVVDVRTAEEYAEKHLEGAINIDVTKDDFRSEAEKKLNKGKRVAVYCRSGRRSAAASTILTKAGFNDVINLNGGIDDLLIFKEKSTAN